MLPPPPFTLWWSPVIDHPASPKAVTLTFCRGKCRADNYLLSNLLLNRKVSLTCQPPTGSLTECVIVMWTPCFLSPWRSLFLCAHFHRKSEAEHKTYLLQGEMMRPSQLRLDTVRKRIRNLFTSYHICFSETFYLQLTDELGKNLLAALLSSSTWW